MRHGERERQKGDVDEMRKRGGKTERKRIGKRGEGKKVKYLILSHKKSTKWIVIVNYETVQEYSAIPFIWKIRNNYP